MTKRRKTRQNPEIREFILRNVSEHQTDIAAITANRFKVSRQAVNGYIKRLISEKLLTAKGQTRARKYELRKIVDIIFKIELVVGIAEDYVWRFRILPKIKNLPKHIVDICQYGFTEILNNAIDHSSGKTAIISFWQTYDAVEIHIFDDGIGIFEKIKSDFNLLDYQSALLELSKGKITSDTTRHAGEGIFFTSRMFDKFEILANDAFYIRKREDDDEWLIESGEKKKPSKGTSVFMQISRDAKWTHREVFENFSNDSSGFRRTHVPVKLGVYGGEELVSRSQAKRILARFDLFSEVMLDFKDVKSIGQPFADEIFRVYRDSHPSVRMVTFNTTPEIVETIDFVRNAAKPISTMNIT